MRPARGDEDAPGRDRLRFERIILCEKPCTFSRMVPPEHRQPRPSAQQAASTHAGAERYRSSSSSRRPRGRSHDDIRVGVPCGSLPRAPDHPAINTRAERLARRRAEALFPMSISSCRRRKYHCGRNSRFSKRESSESRGGPFRGQAPVEWSDSGVGPCGSNALETEMAGATKPLPSCGRPGRCPRRLAADRGRIEDPKPCSRELVETLTAIEEAHARRWTSWPTAAAKSRAARRPGRNARGDSQQAVEKIETREKR